jgi:CHASE2 domain-containing sensor protein
VARPDEVKNAIRHEFFVGLALTVCLWILYMAFVEHTKPIEDFRWRTFKFLEGTSSFFRKGPDNPVIIVDIADLPATASATGFTPRDKLKKILLDLVCAPPYSKDQENQPCAAGSLRELPLPAVIGVDIDFSPEQDANGRMRFIDPSHDRDFFEFCESFNTPVFLGVWRTRDQPWNFWLGLPQYRQLAAALPLQENPEKALTTGSEAPTFASALASTYYKKSQDEYKSLFDELWDVFLEQESHDAGVRTTVIDYSSVRTFEIVPYTSLTAEVATDPEKFHRKIVIVGDAHPLQPESDEVRKSDTFEIPLHDGNVGGALVHAAAVYTLIHPENRFWTLKPLWDGAADLFWAAAVTLGLTYFRYRQGSRDEEILDNERREEKQNRVAFWLFAAVAFLTGIVISSFVMWDGCLIVAISLAIHPIIHGRVKGPVERFEKFWKHYVKKKSVSH